MEVYDSDSYCRAFEQGVPVTIPDDSGLRGRILRGKKPEDFENLGLPGRELVFTMGPDGLAQLPGRPAAKALGAIGLGADYVRGRVAQGYVFKLAVFEGKDDAPLATWDNMLDMVASCHPQMAPDIQANRQRLKEIPYEILTHRMLPYDMEQIDLEGPGHPEYMTTERYLAVPEHIRQGYPLHLRRWLLHNERIGVLFAGNGYTQTEDGGQGLREYLMINRPLADLSDVAVLDMPFSQTSDE